MKAVESQNVRFPTLIGCGALAVWSLYALVVSELVNNLPVFETLFLMFATGFVAMSIRITLKKRWHLLKQPLWIWIVGILGVCGSDIAYVTAVKYAPPAHVDFIDYLWPFLVILFTSFLPKERFTWQHLIGGFLGLLGVFLLLTGGKGLLGFQNSYLQGYLLALTAALIWSTYTVVSRNHPETPIEMIGMYCGIGMLLSGGLHCQFETWVMPSGSQGVMVGLLGLSSGIAYLLWSYGTQKGNIKLLSVLAYFTPVISMGLLVFCGKEPMSFALVLACLLVLSGVVIGSINWSRLRLKEVSTDIL